MDEVLSWAILAIGGWSAIIVVLLNLAKNNKKTIDKYTNVRYNVNMK